MAKRKGSPELFQALLEEYNVESASDLQEALKDLMGGALESMLNAELDEHIGYEKHQSSNGADNRRNGASDKKVRSSVGEFSVSVPRDRDGSFEPIVVPKREKDISEIEQKILNMYGRGMSNRDIADTIEEIYGFKANKDMVTKITDSLLPEIQEWQNRQLKTCYPFVFVDCMYVSMRKDGFVSNHAVYTILGYTLEGAKEILGIWISQTESKSEWMNIFDELKKRGVEDILFISMDGVSGLEVGAKSIFPSAIVQRCIVHLIRNSTKFIPSKEMKNFCADLKKIYAATNLKTAENALEQLNEKWAAYPGALRVWNDNSKHVFQLYSFGSDVRRIMYTTNAIESIHSSYRKVTKKGTFENENSVYKVLYLRVLELNKKWDGGTVRNWSLVLNQLFINDQFTKIIEKHLNK